MASLSCNRKTGRRLIQFTDRDGKRQTIRLGAVTAKDARTIKGHAEKLIAAKFSHTAVDADTAAWVGCLDGELRERLARVGLVEPLEKQTMPTVSAWAAEYIAGRTDAKPNTIRNMKQAEKSLAEHFAGKRLDVVTEADGDAFRVFLKGKGLGEATIRLEENGKVATAGTASRRWRTMVEPRPIPLRHAGRRDGGHGGLPGCRDAAHLRAGAVGWAAVSERNPGVAVGRCQLGEGTVHGSFIEDRRARRRRGAGGADLPRTCPAVGRCVRRGGGRGRVRDKPVSRREREPSDAVLPDHPAGRADALGQTVSELPIQPGNGACRAIPPARGDGLAWKHHDDCGEALLADDGRTLCQGGRFRPGWSAAECAAGWDGKGS